jgi:hypothetical protein
MAIKEWQETAIACRNPACEQSTTRPCRSARGAKAIEHGLHLARLFDIERQDQFGAEILRQRPDEALGLLVEVGHRQLGPEAAQLRGAAERYAGPIGDPDHKAAKAAEHVANPALRIPDPWQDIGASARVGHAQIRPLQIRRGRNPSGGTLRRLWRSPDRNELGLHFGNLSTRVPCKICDAGGWRGRRPFSGALSHRLVSMTCASLERRRRASISSCDLSSRRPRV